jgi:hypothetical protein
MSGLWIMLRIPSRVLRNPKLSPLSTTPLQNLPGFPLEPFRRFSSLVSVGGGPWPNRRAPPLPGPPKSQDWHRPSIWRGWRTRLDQLAMVRSTLRHRTVAGPRTRAVSRATVSRATVSLIAEPASTDIGRFPSYPGLYRSRNHLKAWAKWRENCNPDPQKAH